MMFEMKLQKVYFDAIRDGIKNCEGRINDEKRKAIKIGDVIKFTYGNEFIEKTVIDILILNTFRDAFDILPVSNCLPGIENVDEGINIYYNFGFEEGEKKYGVVFFIF